MKNIHVLPTDKPSRLFDFMTKLILVDKISSDEGNMNRHIYITNSEEIKEGDWVINNLDKLIGKSIRELNSGEIKDKEYSKIILTTDQDLINDGVQAIDDKFIGWFVKNPSCEWVKVKKVFDEDWSEISGAFEISYYKIIIPKEEVYQVKGGNDIVFPSSTTIGFPKPKQETLEEAAEKWVFETNGHKWSNNDNTAGDNYGSFIAGAKWQAERMYSEEEVKELILDAINSCTDGMSSHNQDFKEWFEENKKK